jgi:hypothetical protein
MCAGDDDCLERPPQLAMTTRCGRPWRGIRRPRSGRRFARRRRGLRTRDARAKRRLCPERELCTFFRGPWVGPTPNGDWALRTERPRRAERLSRPTGGGGKGVPSGDLAGLPSGSASSLLRAAILFAVARKSPCGLSNKTSDRGGETSARKGKLHPSFVCEAATVRVLDADGREVHSAIRGNTKMIARPDRPPGLSPRPSRLTAPLFAARYPQRYPD